ncbi:MAG: ThuA domain-containing protein [Thermoguttaceae bacterium]
MKNWAIAVLSVSVILSAAMTAPVSTAAEPIKKVLIVVGPSSHPPGSHEVAAGGRLMAHCLGQVQGVQADLVEGWPQDKSRVAEAATIVFIGDIFPPQKLPDRDRIMAELSAAMDRGCGLVCVHYATGLRKEDVAPDGSHPLLGWLGGYFATGGSTHHKSVARIVPATLTPEKVDHPILRGWKEFHFDDEPYWNNYFGKDGPAPNVTALVTTMLPPEAPKKETVVWAVQRTDGGRGVGLVIPHYFRNWRMDDLRTLVLNSICWSAGCEIPAEGIRTTLPDLATFGPVSVEPAPLPKKPQPKKPQPKQ